MKQALFIDIQNYIYIWVECLPMAQETRFQSQVDSYQQIKKVYLILPCLTLSIIRCVSSVKWSNPGKRVAPSPISWYSSYWKGSLQVALDYGNQLYFYLYIYIYIYSRFLMNPLGSCCNSSPFPLSLLFKRSEGFSYLSLLYQEFGWLKFDIQHHCRQYKTIIQL